MTLTGRNTGRRSWHSLQSGRLPSLLLQQQHSKLLLCQLNLALSKAKRIGSQSSTSNTCPGHMISLLVILYPVKATLSAMKINLMWKATAAVTPARLRHQGLNGSGHWTAHIALQACPANLASVGPKNKTAGMLQGPSSTAALCASQQAASNSRASQKQANAGVYGANVAKNTLWEDSEADQRPGTQCVKLRGIGVDNGIQVPAVNGSEAGNDVTTEGHEAVHIAGPEKWQYDSRCWESFHARDNATARFYKERRYKPMARVFHPTLLAATFREQSRISGITLQPPILSRSQLPCL